jgi:hypothetical protein
LDAAARRHYGTTQSWLVRGVLDRARRGTLTTSWREDLKPPTYNASAHQIYADADFLAVEEIRQTTTAPWEPNADWDWRTALDAWYLAYRSVLVDQAVTLRRALDQSLQTRNKTLATLHLRVRGAASIVPLGEDVSGGPLIAFDHNLDLARRGGDESYIAERDSLGASYLAGLKAGGETCDWVGWLEKRIAAWTNLQAAEAARARLANAAARAELESLPSYWIGN